MKRYQVIAEKATFNNGDVVELTSEQAADRMHSLKFLKGQAYQVTDQIELKRGEVIGFDGETNKALLNVLEESSKSAKTAQTKTTKTKKAKTEKKVKASSKAAESSDKTQTTEPAKPKGTITPLAPAQ